jgi:transposase-like protein
MESPKTLQQAILFYSNEDNCIAYMVAARWPDGVVVCPTCGRNDVSWLAKQKKWQCKSKHTKRQFSAKVGTIFEDSPLGLDKWLMATWMLSNCKNGVSSYEIAKAIGVTQKSAWFMLHRIRLAMKNERAGKIGGSPKNPVQIDETYIGGNPRNMHEKRRIAHLNGDKKAIVMGMLTRNTREVRAMVVPNAKRETLQGKILEHVGWGAHLHTDQHPSYDGVDATHLFVHKTVNHTIQYVNGQVHTQGIENFWSLLKRMLRGTYVAVEPFHLDRYLDEQVFRFNNCGKKMNDAKRFEKVLSQVAGKRLTYAEVTGKVGETAAF